MVLFMLTVIMDIQRKFCTETHKTKPHQVVVILNSWSPVDDFEFRSDQFLPVSTLHLVQPSSSVYSVLFCLLFFYNYLISCVVIFSASLKPAVRCPCCTVPGVYFRAALQAAAGGDGVRHQNARASCHLLCHRESEHAGEASRCWLEIPTNIQLLIHVAHIHPKLLKETA